ncbi:hypothetical protein ABZ434_34490, partial [Streptomyces sp. NPDC005761]
MRSARTLFATAAVTAVLTITAPSAYAMTAGDWEHDSGSSSSSEDGGWKKDKPEGGVHTGGGALAKTVTEWQPGKDDESGKDDWKKDKPEGGVHTGGGALAKTVTEWQPGKDDE